MKKFILLLIVSIAISVNAKADSMAKCLLHHQGTVSVYDGDKIESAIKASTDGDTIFLSEGTYPGFTLNKKITVRGAGQETRITGDVKISLSNNPTLTQTLMEWLNLDTHNITVETAMKKVKIKQCMFNTLSTSVNNVEDVLVDRCHSKGYIIGFKSATIVNSKISYVSSGTGGHEYLNCNIYQYHKDSMNGKYTNCIFYTYASTSWIYNSFFRNCLFYYNENIGSTSSATNCWFGVGGFSMSSSTINCSWSKYDLENKGYIGTDGTVIGIEGGSTPFTLEPSVPKVTNSTVAYDAANKLLKVNLTVISNNE